MVNGTFLIEPGFHGVGVLYRGWQIVSFDDHVLITLKTRTQISRIDDE